MRPCIATFACITFLFGSKQHFAGLPEMMASLRTCPCDTASSLHQEPPMPVHLRKQKNPETFVLPPTILADKRHTVVSIKYRRHNCELSNQIADVPLLAAMPCSALMVTMLSGVRQACLGTAVFSSGIELLLSAAENDSLWASMV